MSAGFQSVFEDCLNRLLRGEATLEQCLHDHPAYREELRDFLVIALDLQRTAPVPMTQAEMARGLALLDEELERLRARRAPPERAPSRWRRLVIRLPRFQPFRLAGAATAIAVALIAYGGVTLAAVNSGPDSALYGYRLALEEFRISRSSNEDQPRLHLEAAEERRREIERSVADGNPVAVRHATDAYEASVRRGITALDATSLSAAPEQRERVIEEVEAFRQRLRDHQAQFESLAAAAAPSVQGSLRQAWDSAEAGLIDVHSGPYLALAPTATPEPTPAPPTPTAEVPVVAETQAPTPTPTAPAEPEATPTATATPGPTPSIVGTETVVMGVLDLVASDRVMVSGVELRIDQDGEAPSLTDAAPGLGAWVEAVAVVNDEGALVLQRLRALAPAKVETTAAAELTGTPEATPAPTGAPSATPTPEPSPTPTAEGTPPPTATLTPSAGAEATPTATPSAPAEGTPTPTPATTPEATPAPAEAPSPTATPEASPTPTAATTPSPTATPDAEATPTATPSAPAEGTPTPTPEPTPEATPAPTETSSPTPTAEPSPTAAAETTPSPTATPTPSPGAEATPTASPAPTATASPEATPSPTATPTPAETPTASPTPSATPAPGATASPTPTETAGPEAAEGGGQAIPERPWLLGVLQILAEDHLVVGGVRFVRPAEPALEIEGEFEPGAIVRVDFDPEVVAEGETRLVARKLGPAAQAASPTDAQMIEITGVVEAMDDAAIMVDGQVIALRSGDAPTIIEGDLEIGARVTVEALETEDGPVAERATLVPPAAEATPSTTPQPAG